MRKLITLLIIAGLAVFSSTAYSGLLGDAPPVITVVKTGNTLTNMIIGNVHANKGIVNAFYNDRFILESFVDFYDATSGVFITGTIPEESGLTPADDSDLRKGSTVEVAALTHTIPGDVASDTAAVLNGGNSVNYDVTISLVLVDGAGKKHILDTVTVGGVIVPEVVVQPYIEPTSGIVGTSFTIYDPQGRMIFADRIIFSPLGEPPEQGYYVSDALFSEDGTTATGTIPSPLFPGTYYITVHQGDPLINPPLFTSIAFEAM
jgi:hypothetical protein